MMWRVIPGYEDYMVSSDGQVMSLKCNRKKILKPSIKSGYYFVVLLNGALRKNFLIHQLVAISFLNHIPNGRTNVIDHINSNKLDNRLENLRIVSIRENSSKISEKGKKSSKYIGVHWRKDLLKWCARISINNKRKHLGYYNNEYEAHLAYTEFLSKL